MITPTAISPRLWLVRHGQTDWNVEKRIQGHTPTDLNAAGRRQAAGLANYFSRSTFAGVYSSDLPRALNTARIIADRLGLSVSTTTALRERNLGLYEGKTWDEIHMLRSDVPGGLPPSGDLADWTGVPGVETDQDLWMRVQRALREISDAHAGPDPGDYLVITHGGVLKHTVCHTLGIPPQTPRRFPISNGMTVVLQQRQEYFYLLSLLDIDLVTGREPAADTSASTAVPSA